MKKILLTILLLLLSLILVFILTLIVTEYKPEDIETTKYCGNKVDLVPVNKEIKVLLYNIGFCANTASFSFFTDGGDKVNGKDTFKTLENITKLIDDQNPDIILINEIDKKAKRSENIDQVKYFQEKLSYLKYNCFATNYKNIYVPYPLKDPIGNVESGQYIQSRYFIDQSQRISLKNNDMFFKRICNLKKCLLVSRLKTENNKELVIILGHLIAYDKTNETRKEQLALISEIANKEVKKGNYVIVACDWNQRVKTISKDKFIKAKEPFFDRYNCIIDDTYLKDFNLCYDPKFATSRALNQSYDENCYRSIVDYYYTSSNIKVIDCNTINNNFLYSDHNCVSLNLLIKD